MMPAQTGVLPEPANDPARLARIDWLSSRAWRGDAPLSDQTRAEAVRFAHWVDSRPPGTTAEVREELRKVALSLAIIADEAAELEGRLQLRRPRTVRSRLGSWWRRRRAAWGLYRRETF